MTWLVSPIYAKPCMCFFRHLTVTGCLLLFLSACSGGTDHVAREIPSPTKTRLASDFLLFADSGPPSRIDVSCSADTCEATYLGVTETLSDDRNTDSWVIETQPVRPRNGISLAYRYGSSQIDHSATQYIGYGGWLEYNAFGFWDGTRHELGRDLRRVYSYSHGLATNTNPTRGGTWKGVMVGVDIASTQRAHTVEGDAEITMADFRDPQIDVSFRNIYDADGARYADMTWNDLPLVAGGFQRGSNRDSIEGKYYGPNHEEIGGIFERNRILGAFGAERR